jgi:sodium transport system ATP-binding protein
MLDVCNLRKVFTDKSSKEIVAVNNLSFTAAPGEIVGILGMNGAGKSTALRMLATVISPSSGHALLDGKDMHKDSLDVRRSIGFLSGSTGLYKRLTARETIVYFASLNGMNQAEIKQRTTELVELLSMHEFVDRKCEKLSTGQKQKVNIARTIIHNPSLLILDEATTGLDVVATQSIINFIKHMKNEQRVILFSTHHMHEVEILCDRVLILHKGKLMAQGNTADVPAQLDCENMQQVFNRYADQVGTVE